MKKIIIGAFLMLMCLTLVSCRKEKVKLTVNTENVEIHQGEEFTLIVSSNKEYTTNVVDKNVIKFENNVITGLKEGTTSIQFIVEGKTIKTVTVNVLSPKFVPVLSIEKQEYSIHLGLTEELDIETNVSKEKISYESKNKEIAIVEKGVLKALTEGETTIIISLSDYPEYKVEIEVEVLPKDEVAPVITFEGVEQNTTINLFERFDYLKGIKIIDDVDGDVLNNIVIEGTVDNSNYGSYEIVYIAKDRSGNESRVTREITVDWISSVNFIGHGGSYYGVMNSEEAILYAAKELKYQAIEVDLKMTSDGVFVLCHDDTFGGKTVATTPYSVLKDVEVTSKKDATLPMKEIGKTVVTYTSKICTLERYLEICKEYGVTAVIELKSCTGITNSDQSNMPKLMKMIEDKGMLDQCILLGSTYNALIWTRNNGYEDVACQYLVSSCASEAVLERCIKYNLDISMCVTYGDGQIQNTPAWIARYKDAGLKVSVYTFTQYSEYSAVQYWIDRGVDYVTVDWHSISKLKLPVKEETVESTLAVEKTDYSLFTGETEELVINTNLSKERISIRSLNEDVVTVKNGALIAVKEGTATILVSVLGEPKKTIKLNVEVKALTLSVEKTNYFLNVGETEELVINTNASTEKVEIKSQNENIVTVENGILTAVKEGNTTILVSIVGQSDKIITLNVEVKALTLSVEKINYSLKPGETEELVINTNSLSENIVFESQNENIATVENGVLKGVSEGSTKVIVSLLNNPELKVELTVVVEDRDEEAPIISFDNETEKVKVNLFGTFDELAGLQATDNVDGDVTNKVEVIGTVDTNNYGTYELVYKVSDAAGNEATLTRIVEVVWDYAVQFIGHAGSYYGAMNSEEAILYAARELKYQAIEVDIKITSDGVFVLCHDDNFGDYLISTTPYSVLKEEEVTTTKSAELAMKEIGQTSVTYTTKICTLARYLEICKEYGVTAVIELKYCAGINNSDQSNMPKLMEVIEEAGMLDQCILLGSSYNCLIWTRKNGYEKIPCQYLVNSCESEEYLKRCIDNNLDISINVTGSYSNSLEWIARYKEAGLKVSTYTFTQFTDYPLLQTWINNGVDFVTVDWHNMSKLELPLPSETLYTVTFKNPDGTVLKKDKVKEGESAITPINPPKRAGYVFVGWDKDFTNVQSDLEVTAVYEIVQFDISFKSNLYDTEEKTWATKQEFVDEFYNDFFDWLVANIDNIEYLTYSNGVYTMKRNSSSKGTAKFSSAEDIKALDLYVFESSLSSFIYKPIEDTNSSDYVPRVDDNYFLNSEPYRTKYINLNAYFLNCINESYSSYSSTYEQSTNNRVQIFFRFHQWCKGSNLPAFDKYPTYFEVAESTKYIPTLPHDMKYSIEDEFILEEASCEGITFVGWYLDREFIQKVEKIEKGTSGNIVLYAKWEIK